MPQGQGEAKRRADACRRRAAEARHSIERHLWLSAAGHYEEALRHLDRGGRSEKAAERYREEHGGDADAEP